jgi:hypothetical protein
MAIREGARADGGWEEGARREGSDMGMASSQAKVVLCHRARHRTTRLLVSIRQCTKQVPYGHHQMAINASLTVRTRLGAAEQS